jgi:hypothetical protein
MVGTQCFDFLKKVLAARWITDTLTRAVEWLALPLCIETLDACCAELPLLLATSQKPGSGFVGQNDSQDRVPVVFESFGRVRRVIESTCALPGLRRDTTAAKIFYLRAGKSRNPLSAILDTLP